VVVEGVETAAQAELCWEYGADAIQGYYYARPVPRHELAAVLQTLPQG
jgi:c-di-GMP phosphodiesterase